MCSVGRGVAGQCQYMTSILDRFRLDGRVAIIAGGASDFGVPIARALAQAGAKVAIADLAAERALRAVSAANEAGSRSFAAACDATNRNECKAFVARVERELGAPGVLVNLIAAPVKKGPSESYDDDAFLRMLDINVRGLFVFAQAVRPAMLRAGGGSIIHFASISGVLGMKEQAAYTASKGAVIQLTRTLAVEWAPAIRVNAIGPSWFMTEGLRAAVQGDPSKGVPPSAPGYLERAKSLVPLGRIAEVEEIAAPVLFLATAASSMVTGHLLMVDGGFTAGRT